MFHIFLSVLVCLGSLSAAADDWPTFGHDHARTAIAGGEAPSAGTIVWAAELGGSVDGSPVVSGDRIYVGNSSGEFFALDRVSGGTTWQWKTGGAITGAAEIAGQTVLVGSVDGFVYCLDAASGKLIWRHRTLRPVLASPVFLGDRVVIASTDGTVRAVRPADGKTIWRQTLPGPVSATPAVLEGILYVGDESGHITAMKAADGSVVWQGALIGRIVSSPTVAGDRLVVPLMSLSALSPPGTEFVSVWGLADGTKLWTIPKPAAQSVTHSPIVYDGIVWVFSVEGYVSSGVLRGFRLDTGEQLVEQKFGTLVVDSSPAIAGESMFLAGQNGVLHFLSARTGAVAKRVQIGRSMFSSPAIADGKLYIGCQDGKLYCIE